jgi:hypothetical protein
MAKNNIDKSSTQRESPVKFSWGTFCRTVLAENGTSGSEHTLFQIMPALKLLIQLQPGLPDKLILPLGPMSVHATFKNKNGQESDRELQINAEINFAGKKSPVIVPLKVQKDTLFSQLTMKLMNPTLELVPRPGHYEFNAVVSWNYNTETIGKVEMPIVVDIIGETKS